MTQINSSYNLDIDEDGYLYPKNSVYQNVFLTNNKVVFVADKIVKVVDKTNVSNGTVNTILVDTQQPINNVTVTDNYIVLETQEQQESYTLHIYALNNSSRVKQITQNKTVITITNSTMANLTVCNGPLYAVDQNGGLLVYKGCPTAQYLRLDGSIQSLITGNLTDINYTILAIGLTVQHKYMPNSIISTQTAYFYSRYRNTGTIIGYDTTNQRLVTGTGSNNFIYYFTSNVQSNSFNELQFNKLIQYNTIDTFIFFQNTQNTLVIVADEDVIFFKVNDKEYFDELEYLINNNQIATVQNIIKDNNDILIYTDSTQYIYYFDSSASNLTDKVDTYKEYYNISIVNNTNIKQIYVPIFALTLRQSANQGSNITVSHNLLQNQRYRQILYLSNSNTLVFNTIYYNTPVLIAKNTSFTYSASDIEITSNTRSIASIQAGKNINITFKNTSNNCDKYYIQVDNYIIVKPNYTYNTAGKVCSAEFEALSKVGTYTIKIVSEQYSTQNNIINQSLTITPGNISNIRQAFITPSIVRINQSFTISIFLSDSFGNAIKPMSEDDCQKITGQILQADFYDNINYYTYNTTKVINISFSYVNGSPACSVYIPRLPFGKYVIKLLQEDDEIILPNDLSNSLIMQVYKYPVYTSWNAKAIISIIFFIIIFTFSAVGLPLLMYLCVNREYTVKNVGIDTSKFEQQKHLSQNDQFTNVLNEKLENSLNLYAFKSGNNIQKNETKKNLTVDKDLYIQNHMGLGQVEIPGKQLLYNQNAVLIQQLTDVNVEQDMAQKIAQHVSKCLQKENEVQISIYNQYIIKFIKECDSMQDYINQLYLWQSLDMKNKLEIFSIYQYNIGQTKSKKSQFSTFLDTVVEFDQNVKYIIILITEYFQSSSNVDDSLILEELEQLLKLKPPRYNTNFSNNQFITEDGIKIGPPYYFGEDYLLYGYEKTQ